MTPLISWAGIADLFSNRTFDFEDEDDVPYDIPDGFTVELFDGEIRSARRKQDLRIVSLYVDDNGITCSLEILGTCVGIAWIDPTFEGLRSKVANSAMANHMPVNYRDASFVNSFLRKVEAMRHD